MHEEVVSVVKRVGNVPRSARRKCVGIVLPLALVVGQVAPSIAPAQPAPGRSQSTGQGSRGDDRPNILLIVTDDQRDDLTMMPRTRRLAEEEGIRFPNFVSTTPLCCPSRSTIMTGRYAHNHGVRSNRDAPKLNHENTVQAALDEAGYRTALFGKFLNKWPISKDPPHFDRFAILNITSNEDRHGYYEGTWNVNGAVRQVDDYTTHIVGREGARFVRESEQRGRPWLLFLTPFAPHLPYTPEPKYANAPVPTWQGNPAVFEKDKTDKPRYVQNSHIDLEHGRASRRDQLRTLMSVDDLVARMIGVLKKNNARRNTLVVFMSDNGYFWGEHGLTRKSPPYLQGVKVPFVMSWPGRLSTRVDTRLAATVDVTPTIYDVTGVSPPAVVDGRSLVDDGWARSRLLLEFWESKLSPPWISTVTKKYQYVEYSNEGQVTFKELYWLEDDPWELINVLGDRRSKNDPSPGFLSSLHAQLEQDSTCRGSACP